MQKNFRKKIGFRAPQFFMICMLGGNCVRENELVVSNLKKSRNKIHGDCFDDGFSTDSF